MHRSHRTAAFARGPAGGPRAGLAALLVGLVAVAIACETRRASRFQGDLAGLEPASSRRFDEVHERRGAALGSYWKLLVEPVARGEGVGRPGSLRSEAHTGSAWYRDRDVDAMRAELRERVIEELGEDYLIVEEPGPDVLRVRFTLTDLTANRPPLDIDRSEPTVVHRSAGAGGAAMQLELRDAATDELLFAAVDRFRGWEPSSNIHVASGSTWGDAKRAFDIWARGLRAHLDRARAEESARLSR